MRKNPMVLVVGLVLVGAIVGCSSKDEGSSGTSTTQGSTSRTADASARGATVAVPTVTGPVTGGKFGLPHNPMPAGLAEQYGYTEQEFFVGGTATAYAPQGALGEDGKWAVVPTTTAPYETRIVVRRPTDAAKFNGTVIVEWLNVTSGMDADPDFGFAHDELMRDGYAYIGVSAQAVGVVGGGVRIDIPGVVLQSLKEWDPERYASLAHPGDDYSYDIFSQVAQAIRRPDGVDPLGGLQLDRLIATGESQSAARMVTYADAIQPVASIYDGIVIHSRGGSGTDIVAGGAPMPKPAHIRDDLDVPVMQLETETDLFGLGFYPATQPDTDKLRTWEMAGTAHADQFTLDYGVQSGREWDTTTQIDFTTMCGEINAGPQTFVVRKAFADMNAWIENGTSPATGAPLQVVDGKAIARDQYGNALGGVRTPAVDVPIATLSGEPDPGESVICSLFGSTTAFTPPLLASLYPSHDDYVRDVTTSAQATVDAGFLLPADQAVIVDQASAAAVPG